MTRIAHANRASFVFGASAAITPGAKMNKKELESFVLELAESDPWIETDDENVCAHCRVEEDESHRPGCVWMRARRAMRMSDAA